METPELEERFSRQVILPFVGAQGQKKWEFSTVLLAGEGVAFQSAKTALETSGLSKIIVLSPESPQVSSDFSMGLVVTEKTGFRRQLSRRFRQQSKPVLFAWPSGSGFALFIARHQDGNCPCLECFETMNPKAFGKGPSSVQRILGAMAASETLQWVLRGESPLEGKVWITSLDGGLSFQHQVQSTYKCPARLLEEGAMVTP